ncbi:DUF1080 domain-containing protein [Labilibaculum sp. A4]|uniref:3-keto-disaccharide hydrolase n=1 Tax=Labilibaculum euxinus TaxID=2686357 RepID=UPI000F618F37|nr:DUF1080 domain-containing protein [Labilibaculum euxinus]MDQ1771516.1 DUF1080 domain-containing protein [Labilibaculum euxinus]MWN76596.1 DUF1080 domain-containing protein [Labilibaculum euxinus]
MTCIYRLLIFSLVLIPNLTKAQSNIELFNQKDLSGWYAYEPESGKHENALELFAVDQQMIRLYGNKAGYLMSEQSFDNFQLCVEFRWNTDSTFVRKSNKKNSGITYLVPKESHDTLWPKGVQFQVKEGATGDFIFIQNVTLRINGVQTEPGRSVVAKRFTDASNAIGEWNTAVITVVNGKIKQELNGKLVNEGVESSVSKGRILLQYEGYPIDFRKVQIKKL